VPVSRARSSRKRLTLVGTWKLVSNVLEHKGSGQRELVHGRNPNGYAIFTAAGRLMAIMSEEGREPAGSRDECVRLFNSMVAYSGRYRVEGNQFITTVEVSWNKWWNGQEHLRCFKVTDNRLEITTAWEPIRPVLGSPLVRMISTWKRAI
jgi:hypothetical protein